MPLTPAETAALVDYRHQVEALYTSMREGEPGEATWRRWCQDRDHLFGSHRQSPLGPEQRPGFTGLPYFPYDPTWRLSGQVEPLAGEALQMAHSASGTTEFRPFGMVHLQRSDRPFTLTLFWLAGYGGGVFLPFRDATNGASTYGGGRYLLDTVKGADLGTENGEAVFDFNYAYHPSCTHDPRWSCPLAPPHNRLELPIEAGERLPG